MNSENLRDMICKCVDEAFDHDLDAFFDVVENNAASPRFDCVHSNGDCPGNGENYIIDRDTGQYVNWYKLYHLGRDPHTNIKSEDELQEFFINFKKESVKSWNV